MKISYSQVELVDTQKVEIFNENDPYFWNHKGRKLEEKENLRQFAKLLPDAIKKQKEGMPLTPDEEYSYNIFIENGPQLSYDEERDVYTVVDGRHRLCMLRDEGINIEAKVLHFVNFREKTMNEAFASKEDIEVNNNEEKNIEKKSLFQKFFDVIKHIINKYKLEEKEYDNTIDKLAIINSQVNKEILSNLGIEIINSFDGYFIVTQKQASLDEVIKKFSENDVLVSTQEIRFEEER